MNDITKVPSILHNSVIIYFIENLIRVTFAVDSLVFHTGKLVTSKKVN